MIQIEDEDIVVLTCARGKSTDRRLYRCGEKSDPCFCIFSKQGNSCFCLRREEGVIENSCSCPHDDRKEIRFVANRDIVPKKERDSYEYVHPDGLFDRENGKTWRQLLEEYNGKYNSKNNNTVRLLRAHELYKGSPKGIYGQLHKKLRERFYILSAGWGLIKADYLLPNYNITFADEKDENKLKYNERSIYTINSDRFCNDFNQLPSKFDGAIHFLGGKNYHNLFYELSRDIGKKRYVWYWREIGKTPSPFNPPSGFIGRPYESSDSRNWHYNCVKKEILNCNKDFLRPSR